MQFLIERPTRETAENIDAFDQQKAKIEAGALGHYRILAPAKTRELPGIHVYYVHELPPNGVYLGANICFIKETASLRKVPGGIDEPLPRVTSHEIGHALGLPHRQDLTNLMASGTTGTLFNEAELKISRAKAALMNGAMTLPQAQREAKEREKQGDKTSADLLNKLLEAL